MNVLARFLFERKLKSLKRKVQVSSFDTAETALILFNADLEEDVKPVENFLRFLQSHNIEVMALGYYPRKNDKINLYENDDYLYFHRKDINIRGAASDHKIKRLMVKDFDLLFDFNRKNIFPLKYISGLSRAKFKVGKANAYQKEICDLTIQLKEDNLKELITQIKYYLPKFQQKQ